MSADDHDDQEQQPGDRRGLAEVAAREGELVEVEHERLVLAVRAAVDVAGEPWSNSFGSAKICSPPIVEVMMTKIMVGRIIGIVIDQKRRMRPAPSIAADS